MWNGFEKYRDFDPLVDVFDVVRSGKPTIHRFFDTSPLSPSGRYMGLTEFPFEDRLPKPGDQAAVIVIDLQTGEEVYRSFTSAWDTQVGAQVQWGGSDDELFFNRMDEDTWTPYGVRANIHSGEELRLGTTVYVVSSDGRYVLTPCLKRIGLAQAGYGVCVPDASIPRNLGAPEDDGVYMTDCVTGKSVLLMSIARLYEALKPKFADLDLSSGSFYGFHAKWNPQDDRIMFILRWLPKDSRTGKTRNYLITFKPDGSEIHMAIDAKRWGGGHHPNWCPDGERIIMNLVFIDKNAMFPRLTRFMERVAKRLHVRYFSNAHQMRFGVFRFDGSDLKVFAPSHYGSGHPTMHVDGVHMMTDCYPYERVAFSDRTVPLRWVNAETDKSVCAVRVPTTPVFEGAKREYRIDPHPVWDRSGRWLVFNAARDGVRTVYVADFSKLISA